MKYMLLLHNDETWWQTASEQEIQEGMRAYGEYGRALEEAGAYIDGAPLQGSHATTTISIRDGETITTDGPFAETKEQLGGYYLIECETLDEALEWARRNPSAFTGHVEVRPLMEMPAAVEGGAA
jgi:hypothetical protein